VSWKVRVLCCEAGCGYTAGVPIRKRLLSALVLSSTIYLVPILTAHWIDLFGPVLGHELFRDRELAWKAADVALALIVQALVFACVWWMVPRSKAVAVGVTALLLIPSAMALNFAYLYAIPSYFLIERDTTPDTSAWREECVVEGFSLDPVRQGSSRGLERRGEAWVRQDNGTRYGILRVPGCFVEPVAIPELPIAPGLQQALPDGSVIYVAMERGVAGQQYWLLKRGSKEPRRLEVPDGRVEGAPLVAEDGGWVAWVARSSAREASLRIEPLVSGQPIVFSHLLLQRTTLVLVQLDMKEREVIVNRDLSAFAKLRLDGTVAWGPLTPGAIAAQNDTFRYLDGQWAAWDAYVENLRYRLGWSTTAGKGEYEAPKGRSITSAAMDARGRYVAASTTTALNIGSIRDTVVALRTSDGSEVFRKTLPTYTRSQVAFLGDGYFAYSDVEGTHSRTRVLRITD
jgi:hypothetical protein